VTSLGTRARRLYVPPRRGLTIPRVELPIPGGGGTILGFSVAAAIVACAFSARGGSQLERTTYTEVAFMLAGAALCVAVLLLPRPERTPRRLRGGYALAAFALLAVFTALSVTWSLMPNDSWLETNRTLAYFAVFAGGLALARLRPQSWTALLAGIAISAVALAAWSVLTKVFPAAFATDETYARLRPPFDYWNSVGLAAALGVPALLWLGVRRSGHAALNALAWPGLGLLVMSLMLAVSRGALLAVAIGTAIWLIAVPLRLRAAILIGGVLVATVPLVAWAFAQDGITGDNARMALRTDAGQGFGALLLLLLVTLAVAGLAVGFISAVKPPGPKARARATRVLVGALAVVPAVAILMLASAPGGISGQVSKAWHQATDPAISGPTNSPERLTATSSGRARYWREAMKVHAQAPWLGSGAGSYGTLRLRYRVDGRQVQHAHGYVVQTLSDLGWVGLAVSLLAAGAWLTSAARVVGIPRRDRGLPWDAERIGLATLATVAIVFGLHSAIDWTWFVPGNVLPALLAGGWVVSRTTLRERIGALEAPRRDVQRQVLVPAAAVVTLLGLVAAWSAVQPIRSDHAQTESLERLDKGQIAAAASIARIAHDRNPLSTDPLFDLAAIEQAAGRDEQAKQALNQAIDLEPANPESWRQLGRLQIDLRDFKGALSSYQIAYYLDPRNRQSTTDIVVASRLLAAASGQHG
jgi:O-antigen ligase/polysaccharide polymerase Wzy-like membrane protein